MKITLKWFITFTAYLSLSSASFATDEAKPCEKVEKILYLIQKLHYHAPEFDNAFASKVMENYLFLIDGQNSHLYEKDILALKNIQSQEATAQAIFCKSYDFLLSIYEKRLKETDSLINSCTNRKYTWGKNDSMLFNESFKNNYSKNSTEKLKKIENWIKVYTLSQLELANKLNTDFEFEKNDHLKIKAIHKLRKGIHKKTADPNGMGSYLEEHLLQAIISTCDPHSDYFTPIRNKHFKESLSTTVEIYGFTFEENKNEHIEISSIDPGSPAWKCNNLNVGDQITKIQFKNKPKIDVSDYDITEFYALLDKATEKEMEITVLKKNGALIETHLVKAVVKSDDNAINSYILKDKYPIGYISLPSFYTDFSRYTPLGCANDVAKEILKLKADSIQGLILDLRNNGGGSLDEAVNLVGIFIDAAPLFIQKVQSKKPTVIKDMNRGSIYSGPLIIIINKASASASELLAQMLKTQQRAVIVGSTSFGKANGQIIVPLDTAFSLMSERKSYNEKNGYIKITIEKLYDLNGTTYQKMGVQPHIAIPDLYSSLYKGENGYNNALANDVIEKKVKIEAVPDQKVLICSELSAARIKKDEQFKRVLSLGDTVKTLSENEVFPLYPSKYSTLLKTSNAVDSIIDTVFSVNHSHFTVKPNKNNSEVMQMDEFLQTIINAEMDDLNRDMILRETYNIMTDYNSN